MPTDLPHVTAIIKDAGLMGDMSNVPEGAMERGTAVHLATQYHDEGDLDEGSLGDEVRPRLESYKKFLREMRPEILAIEEAVTNMVYGYCGRLDRIIRLDGRDGVLDIKGPYRAPWHGVQTAAYAKALEPALAYRWSLHLDDTGYLLIEHRDRQDWAAFRAALDLWNWKRRHGID